MSSSGTPTKLNLQCVKMLLTKDDLDTLASEAGTNLSNWYLYTHCCFPGDGGYINEMFQDMRLLEAESEDDLIRKIVTIDSELIHTIMWHHDYDSDNEESLGLFQSVYNQHTEDGIRNLITAAKNMIGKRLFIVSLDALKERTATAYNQQNES